MERRVLVVEDEDNIRALVRRFLSRQGFTVETASDGQDGIEQLAGHSYDAIVLDLNMPRATGIDVLQYLDEANPEMIGRTVIATAYPGVLANDQLQRVCRVVRKPFELSTLLDAVEACTAA